MLHKRQPPQIPMQKKVVEVPMQCEMWAWWNNEKKRFSMIYPAEMIVRMCSPDGFKRAEERGEGKVVKVIVRAV